MHRPPKDEVKVTYKTIGGQIILSKPDSEQSCASSSAAYNGKMAGRNGSENNNNLTLYGAACVSKT